MTDKPRALSRRRFLGTAAVAGGMLAIPAIARAQQMPDTVEMNPDLSTTVRRNASSFRALDWQPYFDNLRNGVILVDINSRALHYWGPDGVTYRLYPTSVPLSEDLTRRGRTAVVLKDPAPDWRPTPAMRQRNPEWPDYVPPGPDNPLGTRALHLTWTY
jgi:L,D-transpeptidase ErfK/SrfK